MRSTATNRRLGVATALTVALAATLHDAGHAAASTCDVPRPLVRSTEVITSGFRYLPGGDDCGIPRLAIRAGSRLSLRNLDFAAHDVRSFARRAGSEEPLFTSELVRYLGTGAVGGVAALAPGRYGFYCTIHPPRQSGTGMRGTLVVEGSRR